MGNWTLQRRHPRRHPPHSGAKVACSRSPIYLFTTPIQVFTMPIWAFTIPIQVFTMIRGCCSRWTDLGVHDGPKHAFLVFFGFRCALVGYLIHRSTFLPRTIGVLMAFAGLGYVMLLWPPLVNYVSPFNLVLAAPGELSLVLWLLVVGVNVERWKEQASAARECGSPRAIENREGDLRGE